MSNSFRFHISRKKKMLVSWSILIPLAILYFLFQWYNYKRHGYMTEYVINSYFDERETNIKEKHDLVVKTLEINNLKTSSYDVVDKLVNDFISEKISEEDLKKEISLIIMKDNIELFMIDLEKVKKDILFRKDVTNGLVRKLNRGENNKGEKQKTVEQLINLKIK